MINIAHRHGGQAVERSIRLFADAALQACARVFAIQFPDETGANLGRTDGFAFVGVGAVAETFRVHRAHHFQDATRAFGVSLGQKRKVRNFGCGKKHGRCVRTRGRACAAADARGRFHREIGIVLRNSN